MEWEGTCQRAEDALKYLDSVSSRLQGERKIGFDGEHAERFLGSVDSILGRAAEACLKDRRFIAEWNNTFNQGGVQDFQALYERTFQRVYYDPFALDGESLKEAHNLALYNATPDAFVLPISVPNKRAAPSKSFMRFWCRGPKMRPVVAPPETNRDLVNRIFAVVHPRVHQSMTLTKLRRLKRLVADMIMQEHPILDIITATYGWTFFERVLPSGCITKENRFTALGACLCLAIKFLQDEDKNKGYQLNANRHSSKLDSQPSGGVHSSEETSVPAAVAHLISVALVSSRNAPTAHSIGNSEFDVFELLDFKLLTPWSVCLPHYWHFHVLCRG